MSTLVGNPTPPMQKLRILLAGVSGVMRELLQEAIHHHPEIEIREVHDPELTIAEEAEQWRADVVVLGLAKFRSEKNTRQPGLRINYGRPIVLCGARSEIDAAVTTQAFADGVTDWLEIPSDEGSAYGPAQEIVTRLRAAAQSQTALFSSALSARQEDVREDDDTVIVPARQLWAETENETIRQLALQVRPQLVAIGASTGGPSVLAQILAGLPAHFPLGIVIVQHLPAGFTELLAQHLHQICAIEVREAKDGETIRPGTALIAPGGRHLRVVREGDRYLVSLDEKTGPVSGHRPTVDVLFASVAEATAGHAAAILLTGSGSDGTEGMGRLKEQGAVTIAQSPDSCICPDMPKSSIARGYAQAIVRAEALAAAITGCGAAFGQVDSDQLEIQP